MTNDSRKATAAEGVAALEDLIRQRVRATIEAVLEEELTAALGAGRSDCVGATRHGDRHGTRERVLTTSVGPTTLTVPRARLRTAAARPSGRAPWCRGISVAPRKSMKRSWACI